MNETGDERIRTYVKSFFKLHKQQIHIHRVQKNIFLYA